MIGSRVTLAEVRKRFGRLEVLRGINQTIEPGRITAMVGPNAAGKTTLIKIILGLVQGGPGSVVEVDGIAVNGDPAYRRRIGYMPQAARFPEHLTGHEIIQLLTGLRGQNRRPRTPRCGSVHLHPAAARAQSRRTLRPEGARSLPGVALHPWKSALFLSPRPEGERRHPHDTRID